VQTLIDVAKLRAHGGRMIKIEGQPAVELCGGSNDNARKRFQYRRSGSSIERRVLQHNGRPMVDGSPWEPVDVSALMAVAGTYHPILTPLGFGPIEA
jgi:hypothetical protein